MVATDDHGQPSHTFHGEGAADRWLALADLPAELPPPRWAVAAERFYRTATIITASDEDVRAAWGGRVSIAEAAHHWLDCGARLVG